MGGVLSTGWGYVADVATTVWLFVLPYLQTVYEKGIYPAWNFVSSSSVGSFFSGLWSMLVDFFGKIPTEYAYPIYFLLTLLVAIGLDFYLFKKRLFRRRRLQQKFSVEVPGSAEPGFGPIHRNAAHPEGLVTAVPGAPAVATLFHNFQHAVKAFPRQPCLGFRPAGADGRAGPFQWHSFTKADAMARAFGSGLLAEGLLPKVDDFQPFALYCKNRPEWVLAEQGLFMYAGTTVPLYDTLGREAAVHILNETQPAAVLTAAEGLANVCAWKAQCGHLKAVVLCGPPPTAAERAAAQEAKLKLYEFDELMAIGERKSQLLRVPRPDDIATFCYTSGTTGAPKGVRLTHRGFIAAVAAAFAHGIPISPGDKYLSYLPLAHVFERYVQAFVLHGGGAIGFYQGDVKLITADLAALRPQIFCSVPRLLNKVHDSIMDGARKKLVTRLLFGAALKAKGLKLRKVGRGRHAFWDRLVFNKVAAKVGLSECRMILSGSAPLAAHVLEFLRVAFPGISGIEGYGQTESTGAATLQAMYTTDAGNVGGPIVSCEIALQSVPDMGYLHTDAAHGEDRAAGARGTPCEGRGEICLRGHNVFMGYYKDEKKTQETIDADGWLHTGDIGIWLPNGALKIVDRKKNLFKLAQGEYVAPEKLENIYGKSSLVGQVFVYGDSLQASLVAVVVPDEQGLAAWAQAKGLAGDAAKLCALPELRADVLADILRVGKESKLHGFEIARAVHLDPEPFSMENGLITTTFKLKRDVAKKHYRLQIDAMYDSLAKK
eukprot:CAMPEP_0194591750 /NCGR_PEP_ID=MMETSP0292-20121207/22285_1 /TAXON_ID=39354 /ORGANISM="Heterosigma akashiwo, Strain CCMP2393" /LENGTH=771 /DNA_ID=CAMNT_0039449951 /DNA_START=50 /DNA_END=2365 /DNA_ORIENTATION=-